MLPMNGLEYTFASVLKLDQRPAVLPTTEHHHTRVVMLGSGEKSRPLVELEYAGEGVLKAVHWQHLDVAGLSSAELDRLRAKGAALRQRRVLAVRRQRKIGPNELCPCGSGRKYKRCCRP